MILKSIVTDCTDPYINLATEEYLTFNAKEQEIILFLWQNAHTVVIGRNQNPWKECRVEAIKKDDCRLARRISGGGAVYHDLGNLNFTFIAREGLYDIAKQTDVILKACRLLGIDAEKNGRNDLTIDGMKFSGHAYFQSGSYCYHHGTIMMDVRTEDMAKYLNVSKAKLKSKGVDSVRSRVTNLINFRPDISKEMMQDALIRAMSDVYGGEVETSGLPDRNITELADLIDKCSSEEWRYGRRIPFEVEREERFPWGSVSVELRMKGEIIAECGIFSDSLETEIFDRLASKLTGVKYDRSTLDSLDLADICGNETEQTICRDTVALITNNI